MLNALTLSASAILLGTAGGITILLAVRVAVAALVTAAFTMFVADYSERRSSLVRGSRQLNMTVPGQLAASRLGAQALRQSLLAMTVAGLASLIGALLPLLVGAFLPSESWIVLVLTILSLGALGWLLGSVVSGRRPAWAAAMLIGGVIVTFIGLELRIT
jgi:predicted membrane protein (TIGR00267 family)